MIRIPYLDSHTGGEPTRLIPSLPFDLLAQNAVVGDLFGRMVKIAAIDDLLEMKRFANRPKDRLDIEALEMIKRGEDPNV